MSRKIYNDDELEIRIPSWLRLPKGRWEWQCTGARCFVLCFIGLILLNMALDIIAALCNR